MKTIVVILLLAFSAMGQQKQAPLDWQGIYPGMTKMLVSTHLPKAYELRCAPEDADTCVAANIENPNPLEAVEDQAAMQFYHGQLASIEVEFPQAYFEATVEKIQQKFAGLKPRIEQTTYRNSFGAETQAPVYTWSRAGTELTATMIVKARQDEVAGTLSKLLYSRPDLLTAYNREHSKTPKL